MKTTEEKLKSLERELSRRKLQLAAPTIRNYMVIMLLVVLANFVVDMFGSEANGIVLTDALFSLFHITSRDVNDPAYKTAFADYNLWHSIASGLALVVLPFYKSLTDKYGRKPFLWLNSLFTGIAMLMMMTAKSLFVYLAGYVILSFFFNGDVHQIYLLEESPAKYRSTLVSATKMLGGFGASFLGVFRLIFVNEETIVDGWRNILMIPVIFTVLTVIISIISLKDTRFFITQRIETLEKEIRALKGEAEIREAAVLKITKPNMKGGVFGSIGFLFKHRQTRAIVFAMMALSGAMIFKTVYSTVLSGGNLTNDAISTVAIVFPIVEGLFSLISGFISDKFGRKVSFTAMAGISLLGFLGWIFSTDAGWSGILVGLLYGILCGGYWGARYLLQFNIMAESVPTRIRATIIGLTGVIATASYGAINFAVSQAVRIAPDITALYFWAYVVLIAVALVIFLLGVHETKTVDMEAVTVEEWDRKKE